MPISSTAASTSSRGERSESTGSCAPTISTRSARVNAAFSIFAAASARRARSNGARAPRAAPRALPRSAARSRRSPRASARHCSMSSPRRALRVWPGGSLSARPPAAPRSAAPSTTSRLCAAHSRSWDERRDHAVMVSRSTPASLGHPGARVDRRPLEPHRLVQFAAQGGLVDHPGGFGFVIQRRAVDRHQLPVGAGLPVGHDDVGVQVRIPAPRRFVLIGDRHQSRQPHQVLLPGDAGCAPGCSRRARPGTPSPRPARWCARRRSPWPPRRRCAARGSATRSWARRTSDRSRAHRAHRMRARARRWARPRRRASAPPPPRRPPRRRAARRSDPTSSRDACGCRRRTATPGFGSRARSSTPPSPPLARADPWWRARRLGGVDVVVDRPPLELRDRQHDQPCRWLRHLLRHNHSRTLVQMCQCRLLVDSDIGKYV